MKVEAILRTMNNLDAKGIKDIQNQILAQLEKVNKRLDTASMFIHLHSPAEAQSIDLVVAETIELLNVLGYQSDESYDEVVDEKPDDVLTQLKKLVSRCGIGRLQTELHILARGETDES